MMAERNWQEALNRISEAKNDKLRSLDLSKLRLTQLPPELFQLDNLKKLGLRHNELTGLPPEFTQLKQLTTLNLSFNQLSSLPNDFSNLKLLTTLDLRANQLSSLPNDFSNLKLLTHLVLRHNQLSSLPNDFSNLSQLTYLDLSFNQLSSLPNDFSNLKQLTSLYLGDNKLSSLPNNFSNLKQLTKLYLSNTQLSSLPSTITQLEKLKRLDLTNSQLKSLPSEITQLQHLDIVFEEYYHNWNEGINLYGNEKTLQHPPVEIIQQGWDAIENYFRQIEKNRDKLYEAKLIFIGDGGAGKTSIMRRLQGESFNSKEEKTDGIEIRKLSLEKEETGFARDFCLHMWDFGGQEIYRDTHRFFLTKDTIYILVTESRKNLNDNDIYYWLNALKLFAPHSPVLLVKNKCEISSSQDIPLQQYKRKFQNLVPWAQVVHTSCTDDYEHTIANLHRTIVKILGCVDKRGNMLY